ncbi:hypothetical protein [Streptomyces sp. NPDC086989]
MGASAFERPGSGQFHEALLRQLKWRAVPADFVPAWTALYAFFRRWRRQD